MRNRFPDFKSVLYVYAVITFVTYGWTFITFFRKFPSWILFLTSGEVGGIFAYAMAVDLFESLFWAGLLVLAAFLLPGRLLRDDFLVRAGWFILVFLALLLMYLIPSLKIESRIETVPWLAGITIPAILAAWLSARVGWMGRFMRFFADRLLILLMLYFPVSAISLGVVIFRLFRN